LCRTPNDTRCDNSKTIDNTTIATRLFECVRTGLLENLEADRVRLDETIARPKPWLSSSISSCACIASTKMSAAMSRHCSPSCANYSGATPSPSRSSTMPKRVLSCGSSEFHAWGDSNLYLRRDSDDRIVLTVEHRAAAAMQGPALRPLGSSRVSDRDLPHCDIHHSRHHPPSIKVLYG
jgi:hypothetical protein